MEKIKQKVEQVLGKDSHPNTTTTGTTHGTTTGTHHAGSDPTGPHSGHMANAADPRVDSDRIGGTGNTASAGGYGQHTTGGGYGQHSGVTGTGASHVPAGQHSDPTGPHDSRMANKLDPRVDADRIGSHGNSGGAAYGTGHSTGLTGGTTHGTHTTGTGLTGGTTHGTHTTGTGLTGTTHGTHGTGYGTQASDPTGPHDSRMANKVDPRVDSDRMGTHGNTGGAAHTTGTGLTGNTHGTHTAGTGFGTTHGTDPTGPHDSRMANKADPRVDSDRIGGHGNTAGTGGYGTHTTGTGLTGNTHSTHTGTGLTGGTHGHSSHLPGPADNTAGPHNSDLMNKMDPRVDSDLDGSKKVGGDRTFG